MPIFSSDDGNVTEFNFEHPAKAFSPIEIKFLSASKLSRLSKPKNVYALISEIFLSFVTSQGGISSFS